MKWIQAHFGEALIAAVCLLALGSVVVGVIKSPEVATQFHSALSTFFTDMMGLAGH